MLFVTNAEGDIELVNNAVTERLQLKNDKSIQKNFWKLLPGEERTVIKKLVEKGDGSESPVETRFVTDFGEVISVNLSYTILSNKNQNDNRIFVASDISLLKSAERKISESLKEKNVLLAEIHHRVKNNLAVISGLLEMQIWNQENDEIINTLRDSQLRIQSIALVHEKLYQTENFANVRISEYIEELSRGIADSFNDPNKNVLRVVDCDDIIMSINEAISFSLLLNEGVVNAYKHAFVGRDEGEIKISLKKEGDELLLSVSDNGIGLKNRFLKKEDASLGMKLIGTLTNQLGGEYSLKAGPDSGTIFEVKFPIG
jgi:PAS domain S-box-containing protein